MINILLIDALLAQSWGLQKILSCSTDNYEIVVVLSEHSSHKYTIILTWLEGSISALDGLTSGFRTSHLWLIKLLRSFIWDERCSCSPASVSRSQNRVVCGESHVAASRRVFPSPFGLWVCCGSAKGIWYMHAAISGRSPIESDANVTVGLIAREKVRI